MSEHKICLSFDFDAWSGMVARGLTTPTPVSRGEFGVVAAERILKLLEKHGLISSWFVPGVVVATYPDLIRRIVEAGHEVGNHGWTHTPPANLSATEEEDGLVRTNDLIFETTRVAPSGYRSPSWDLSESTVDLLIRHGMLYDSSMMGQDHSPYFARRNDVVPLDGPPTFGETTSLVEMPISWSLDDFPHFEFVRTDSSLLPGLSNAHSVEQNWIEDFEYMKSTTEIGLLTMTFHPFVIGRGHRMMFLERLIGKLRDGGATFTRLDTVAQEFSAHPGRWSPT